MLSIFKVGVAMVLEPESQLFCPVNDRLKIATEQRLKALSDLGLLEAQTIPVFEEATQTTAHLLEIPICILGFLDHNRYWFKSAVGLSRLGLMNQLAQERQLPSQECLCTQVVENRQVLVITDALAEPAFADSILVQHYGIRAYLGVPLVDASGNCLGAIAVMDLEPRTFTIQQTKFLELMARWSMSEYELHRLLKDRQTDKCAVEAIDLTPALPSMPSPQLPTSVAPALSPAPSIIQIKFQLLEQLTQELRTPLTSVLGMANVVSREIYGPLTIKQKEYLEIIQDSGRYLLSLVNEISQLGTFDEWNQTLNLAAVDLEMLCQQVLNSVEEAAKRREQQIRLFLEPGKSRTWILDKEKVRQLLYHLISSMIQATANCSNIRLHVSQKSDCLNLAISVSHPWLGEGLLPITPSNQLVSTVSNYSKLEPVEVSEQLNSYSPATLDTTLNDFTVVSDTELIQPHSFNYSCESLRLLLSRDLAQLHGGKIDLQGTPETGYRYVVSLPNLAVTEESA